MKTKDYAMDMRKKINSNDLIVVPSAAVTPYKDGKILLQRRSDTGTWGNIGGGANYGELIEETARRELFEETNLQAVNLRMYGVYSQFLITYESSGDHVNAFSIAFVCEVEDSYEIKFNDSETLESKWFTEKELENIEFWNPKAYELAKDAFLFINKNIQSIK